MLIAKNGTSYGNISDPKTSNKIGKYRHPQFNRDGDTQALPDGYVNLGLRK